ncbi:hypothetical protein ACFPVX_12130 [Cohnella faecalis]|uniref:Uncharacterized protein n=1 Tax=Cohnella faecalis TaxID=2315694 RepID=A0A398CJ80_9BACL|nr:hypothetical protein [Cohnella faecalis]RIE03366.1 hypothetical protein D3H35_11850 [Cohnella faecalis]
MKSKVNRYLYNLGLGIFVLFIIFVILSSYVEKDGSYTITIYGEVPEKYISEIKDPNHLVNGYGLNVPDERVEISAKPFYVLFKKKGREILLVTNNVNKLNEYLR